MGSALLGFWQRAVGGIQYYQQKPRAHSSKALAAPMGASASRVKKNDYSVYSTLADGVAPIATI